MEDKWNDRKENCWTILSDSLRAFFNQFDCNLKRKINEIEFLTNSINFFFYSNLKKIQMKYVVDNELNYFFF